MQERKKLWPEYQYSFELPPCCDLAPSALLCEVVSGMIPTSLAAERTLALQDGDENR